MQWSTVCAYAYVYVYLYACTQMHCIYTNLRQNVILDPGIVTK